MKPSKVSGLKWKLPREGGTPSTEAVQQLVEAVPGLKHNVDKNQYEGSVDAIAAVCHRLGLDGPKVARQRVGPQATEAWPHLRPYQREGVVWTRDTLLMYGGAILADDMGLGKTAQAIEVGSLMPGRKMVVCPAAVRETWRDDFKKFGVLDFAICGPGTTKKDLNEWDRAPTEQWVVCSYEQAQKAYEIGFSNHGQTVGTLIMDEGHLLRGRDAKRARTLQDIAMMSSYKLLLTGTPTWNRPRDFYKLLKILFNTAFGSSFDFDAAYAGGKLNEWGGWDNKGLTNAEELKLRLTYYMLRREKSEVLKDLPSLTRQVVWIDPSSFAKAAFQSAVLNRHPGAVQEALEATLKGKLETAMQLAEQTKRFLLFTYRKDHARQMAKMLTETRETPCVAITGDMPTKRRQEVVKLAAQNGHGVVATIDSVGTGMDALKTVASVGIMHALDYVPQKMAQAEARLHRMGQTENVQWIYLAMRESMDTLVVETIVNKLDQWRKLMGEDSSTGIRNDLNAHTDGAGAVDEKAALRALYEAMETEDD